MNTNNLKSLRLKLNYTQDMLAKALNISRVTYTNYELGKRTPDTKTLFLIADFFGVSIDFLLGYEKKEVSLASESSQEYRDRFFQYMAAQDLNPKDFTDEKLMHVIAQMVKLYVST